MTLSTENRDRVVNVVTRANVVILPATLVIVDGFLKFTVKGSDIDGTNAIKALLGEGFNAYVDDDLGTKEHAAKWTEGSAECDVYMRLAFEGGVFRG